MSANTEVNWVLDELGSVVESVKADYSLPMDRGGGGVTVKRINRDDSSVYDGGDIDMNEPMHKRKEDLETGVLVGATLADRAPEPTGTEYDHKLETVVGIRIEGMTCQGGIRGQVDPAGEDGVPFDVLVRRVRRTLTASRSYPDTDIPHTVYHDLVFTNEAPQSSEYRDFFRYDLDCALRGHEKLP